MHQEDYPAPPQPAQRRKTSGLAVTAFVLSLLFFIPLLPLIGSILGVVAVVRLTSRKNLGGMGLAIAAIPVGLVVVLFLQGILAAIAIPTFVKYTRKAKTVEASEGIDKLRAGIRAYAFADHYDEGGNALPKGAPRGDTGWTPKTPCCRGGSRKCLPGAQGWQSKLWTKLQFAMVDPHYFQWRYQSPDGRAFVAQARGDLDCDGIFSNYQMSGTVDATGKVTFGSLRVQNEIE